MPDVSIASALSVTHGKLTRTVATADGGAIAGAMVTTGNEPINRMKTVFTGADGRCALRTSFAGKLTLRARTPCFQDVPKTVAVIALGHALSYLFG